MPARQTVKKAKQQLRAGRTPSTAAGEFVREEIRHVRDGKHGARSPRQAIAIGLSKARRAGIPLAPPRRGAASTETREAAARDRATGQGRRAKRSPSRTRARATTRALRREPRGSASRHALSSQSRTAASRRTRAERSAAARKGAATKGATARRRSARKAAATRKRRAAKR
jgi:hypothetical protein